MLALLAYFLHARRTHIKARCHRTSLHSAVRDTLGRNVFLIELCVCVALLHRFDLGLFFSQSAIDAEVFCLYDVVLFGLQQLLLLLLV